MTALPPTIPGLPLIGNLPAFARNRFGLLKRGYEQFGPIFSFKLARQPVVALLGPELHQWFFLETDKSLNMDKPYKNVAAVFGDVAFLSSHETYVEQHPMIYAPFKPEKMLSYVVSMQRAIQTWLDSLGNAGEFELTGAINKLVQDIAGRSLLGDATHERLGREFWDLYAIMGKSLNMLIPPHWPLPRNIQREKAKKRMFDLLSPIIAERRRNPEQYDDFLQDMINTPLRSGKMPDDETLIAYLRGLMFASQETTAGQAAWTIVELLRAPEYRQLLQQEVDTHFPQGSTIDAKRLRSLEHVFWAVREIERLHPTADMVLRMTSREVEIQGYRIPANWLVMVVPGVAHRSPKLFADPDRFDPLRFSPGRAEDKQHGYTLIGFGGGKHKCAGMNFANNEMMLITALLFQQFELELVTKDPKTDFSRGLGRPEPTTIRYRRKPAPATTPEPSEQLAAV